MFGIQQNVARYVARLIETTGLMPSDFSVRFEDSGKKPRASWRSKAYSLNATT